MYLKIDHVDKTFQRGSQRTEVLRGITLDIADGAAPEQPLQIDLASADTLHAVNRVTIGASALAGDAVITSPMSMPSATSALGQRLVLKRDINIGSSFQLRLTYIRVGR